ncbi:hypothetical protein B0H17DRAFT_1183722 [Mycena rosella]|uniref:Phytanoyl-CoA dioxygenase n=1 Tax=Mycena rosella TaxID=1033263 RepID=A0AAD7CYL1_MYCRO|nr:hypothetical protein B0H17DRAFT_1183722 [Mycena rosella]
MSPAEFPTSLTAAQKSHFLTHGFVHLSACFSRDASAAFTANLWTRLGMSPDDKSTWHNERTNMPSHNAVRISEFAPKAWSAICELVGGEDRISEETKVWKDSFIVNLGKEGQGAGPFRELDGWHVDGDFFLHFLDSPEQALLVIPIFSDIAPGGGGTAICTDGIRVVARHLYDNPNGVTPWMHVRGTPEPTGPDRLSFFSSIVQNRELASDASFHEMTGAVGDVYLLHPLMVHSASKNVTRIPRVITNPPVTLKAPFSFNSAGDGFSLVEQKTLRELGYPTGLEGWKIEGEREMIVPRRVKIQEEMKERERERLAREGNGDSTFSDSEIHKSTNTPTRIEHELYDLGDNTLQLVVDFGPVAAHGEHNFGGARACENHGVPSIPLDPRHKALPVSRQIGRKVDRECHVPIRIIKSDEEHRAGMVQHKPDTDAVFVFLAVFV